MSLCVCFDVLVVSSVVTSLCMHTVCVCVFYLYVCVVGWGYCDVLVCVF